MLRATGQLAPALSTSSHFSSWTASGNASIHFGPPSNAQRVGRFPDSQGGQVVRSNTMSLWQKKVWTPICPFFTEYAILAASGL